MPIENNIESFNNTKNLEISNYLDMLNTLLSYESHAEHAALGFYTINNGLETLKLYLDAGASPDVVLDAAIRHMHLPSVKLALQYKHKITKSHLSTALKTDNIEIIEFVLLNQPVFDLTNEEVLHCIKLNVKIYKLLTTLLKHHAQLSNNAPEIQTCCFDLLTIKNKRMLINRCIEYFRENSPYFAESVPLIIKYIHETPLKRKNFYRLLNTAIICKCSDIISLLLQKGVLLSKLRSKFVKKVSIKDALEFSNEIKQLLNSGDKLSKKCRKNLKSNLNVFLDFALEKSILLKRPVEELESLVRQGACLTTYALTWLIRSHLNAVTSPDFISRALARTNQLKLYKYMICEFIDHRLNIFDLFSSFLKNYPITELAEFAHQCFKACLGVGTSIQHHANYIETQLAPFMLHCFKLGVDINESYTNPPWLSIKLRNSIEYPTIHSYYTTHSLTFLQAAILSCKHYLVKCLIKNGAVLGNNAIELNCRSYVTEIVQPGLTRSIFELTDRKTQVTYLETIASLRILHRFRVALFIIFNGVSQKESFFNQKKFSPSVILTVLECMWPNKVERETYLTQYKRIMKDNKHFLFKELEPETPAQPIEPHVRLPKNPLKNNTTGVKNAC